jgi:hypothetical protein
VDPRNSPALDLDLDPGHGREGSREPDHRPISSHLSALDMSPTHPTRVCFSSEAERDAETHGPGDVAPAVPSHAGWLVSFRFLPDMSPLLLHLTWFSSSSCNPLHFKRHDIFVCVSPFVGPSLVSLFLSSKALVCFAGFPSLYHIP